MLADEYKTEQNQFDRLGHPGRILNVHTYTSGQVDFTGSMYGYGAVLVQAHGGATASLSGGGEVNLDDIDTYGVIPLSMKQIKGGTDSKVYVFKVRGTV
jgi:hypothetical protein